MPTSNGMPLLAAAGPFTGVRAISDSPYIDWTKFLFEGNNGYIRDAQDASSFRARPGFTNTNASSPIGGGTHRVQGAYTHVDPTTGSIYRFFVANGVLYRSNAAFTTFTNVSPVGITIATVLSGSIPARVAFQSVGASLVVTDGVNRPWVMSNFASTPVTGTYIDIDGAGGAWSTWGKPGIYQDSVFFITATVPAGSAVEARVGIVWCEPNQPAVGYTQSGYANFWNLIETGSDPLYAMLGTNSGLFLWRENSITVATGTPSINFSSTATRDARGNAVGSITPWAISLYGDNIFFLDNHARQWVMTLDGQPEPLWEQLSEFARSQASLTPANMSMLSLGSVVPELNLAVSALAQLSGLVVPTTMSAFGGGSGAFHGEWSIHGGVDLDTIDVMQDTNGATVLCVTSLGQVWILAFLNAGVWVDGGDYQVVLTETGNLSYSANTLMVPDHAVIIVTTPTDLGVVIHTPFGLSSVDVVPTAVSGVTPEIAQYRAVIGLDGVGVRWMQFAVAPSVLPTTQFGLQRIEIYGTTAVAGPDDP